MGVGEGLRDEEPRREAVKTFHHDTCMLALICCGTAT